MPASCLKLPLSHRLLLSHWWPQRALLAEFPPARHCNNALADIAGLGLGYADTVSGRSRGRISCHGPRPGAFHPGERQREGVCPGTGTVVGAEGAKTVWPSLASFLPPPELQAAQAAGAAGAASSRTSTELPTASPEACWGQLASWTAGCNTEADQVRDMPGCCWGLRAQGCWISACCTHPPNELAPACAPAAGSRARWPRRCRGQQRWRALGDACGTLHSTC